MRKKVLSLALALIMVLSMLTMTVFAAANDGTYLYDVKFVVPDGATAPSLVTASYQVRNAVVNSSGSYAYGTPTSTGSFAAYELPLGFGITIDNIRRGTSLSSTDVVTFQAWSDPDNDGIYQQRVFKSRTAESDFSVVSLADNGPFASTGDVAYTNFQVASFLGFKPQLGSTTYSMAFTTDQLCDLFGPNTLLSISVLEGKNYTAQMTCTVLLTGKSAAPAFTDVPAGEWYAAPVTWAVEKGITNGTSATKFSPSQTCTHAQILTFLYRADRNSGAAEAADMDKALTWARQKGMIGNNFDGSRPCTRADAVNYIWQAFGRQSAKASSFTDVPAGAAYAKAVDWAVANGVTNGTNTAQTEFSPNKVCDRGTIVTFLHRAYVSSARLPV